MKPIFLMTHGDWCIALKEAAETIVGRLEGVRCFPLNPGDAMEGYIQRVAAAIEQGNEPLILTDLIGGSAANAAAVICQQFGIDGLSGLDLGLLVAAGKYRGVQEGGALMRLLLDEKTKHSIRQYYAKPQRQKNTDD